MFNPRYMHVQRQGYYKLLLLITLNWLWWFVRYRGHSRHTFTLTQISVIKEQGRNIHNVLLLVKQTLKTLKITFTFRDSSATSSVTHGFYCQSLAEAHYCITTWIFIFPLMTLCVYVAVHKCVKIYWHPYTHIQTEDKLGTDTFLRLLSF